MFLTNRSISKRSRYSVRPFIATLIATLSLICISYISRKNASLNTIQKRSLLHTNDLECHLIHKAIDKCAFVHENCQDEEAGLISYLTFYYCDLPSAKPVAFAILTLWLALLFSTIGIAASDFFCINLSTIATLLGLSENLAGVTFLAFGNGSPDVFSTFAAMRSNSGSLAVGELIGAAGFITAVVAGTMALIKPFKVGKKTFIRDVGFFTVAATFTLSFLYDGKLYLWETVFMVFLYSVYVVMVVTWHWFTVRKKKRRLIEAAARSQYIIPGSGTEELGERYHDDEDGRISPPEENLALLEANSFNEEDEEADDEVRDRILSSISSKMRINRPKVGERRPSHTPIRPSLVGALEFRSVLAGLKKSKNIQSYPLYPRRYSDVPPISTMAASYEELRPATIDALTPIDNRPNLHRTASGNRTRAISAVEPRGRQGVIPRIDFLEALSDRDEPSPSSELGEQPELHLQPHPSPVISISPPATENVTRETSPMPRLPSPDGLAPPRLSASGRPTENDHSRQSLGVDANASYDMHKLDSPNMSSPQFIDGQFHQSPESSRASSPHPTVTITDTSNNLHPGSPEYDMNEEPLMKPLRWWPSNFPLPSALLRVLFPTLSTWADKNWGERTLSIIAVPSVFLLTITLPVVYLPRLEEVGEDIGTTSLVPSDFQSSQNEDVQALLSQVQLPTATTTTTTTTSPRSQESMPFPSFNAQVSSQESTLTAATPKPKPEPAQPDDWNRWLVILQIYTAPIFIVLIIFANMTPTTPQWLIRPLLISLLLSSLAVLAILLTTRPTHTPTWHPLLCFLGFLVSISWISTIAGEVVGVLKAIGVILDISDAILGLTVFAVGNSLGDLVADITVARLGYPVMALSACFGGPMLNILLGIGLSGMYISITGAKKKKHHHRHRHHGGPGGGVGSANAGLVFEPYIVEIDRSLIVSGVALLITLVGLLIIVPMRKWRMDRVVAWGLITLWVTATIGNVILEIWLGSSALS